ncbi:MAG: hypothetical protein ACYTGP_08405 [Planctomycetota bacterium]
MSRWLGVTKPICQRLLRSTRHPGDPLEALSFLPGVRGLRQVVQAAEDRGCDPAAVAAAAAAVDRYEVLIHEHGGSQTRLLASLEEARTAPAAAPAEVTGDDAMLEARRRAFEGLRYVTGRSFQTHVAVFAYRPCDDDPDLLDCMTAMGMIGVERLAHSLPICPMNRFSFSTRDDADAPGDTTNSHLEGLGGEPVATGAPVSVLAEFCSKPLPAVVAREHQGQLSVLVDPDSATQDPFDVMLGTCFSGVRHPALGELKMQDCSLVSEGPSRNLVMAVHLHRSLAQASIPSLACYALGNRGPIAAPDAGEHGPSPANLAAQRWFDRLPDRPRLEHMGIGLEQTGSAFYPRITELVGHLLDAQGWDADEFVGHRCQVEYPVWGAQYLMSFDFRDSEDA